MNQECEPHKEDMKEFRAEMIESLYKVNKNLHLLHDTHRSEENNHNIEEEIYEANVLKGSIIATILINQQIHPEKRYAKTQVFRQPNERYHEFSRNKVKVTVFDSNNPKGKTVMHSNLHYLRKPGIIDSSLTAKEYIDFEERDKIGWEGYFTRTVYELETIRKELKEINPSERDRIQYLEEIKKDLIVNRLLKHRWDPIPQGRTFQVGIMLDKKSQRPDKYSVKLDFDKHIHTYTLPIPSSNEEVFKINSLIELIDFQDNKEKSKE